MPDDLTLEQELELAILLAIHRRLGQEDVTPPSATGLDEAVLNHYLRMAYESSEPVIESAQLKPAHLFQTALMMGIAVGIQLEQERRG